MFTHTVRSALAHNTSIRFMEVLRLFVFSSTSLRLGQIGMTRTRLSYRRYLPKKYSIALSSLAEFIEARALATRMTRKDRWKYTTQGLWVNTAPDDNPFLSSSQVISRVQSVPRERDSKSARRGICDLLAISVDPDSRQSFILSESLLIHIMIDLTVTAFRQDTASSGARTSFIF